MSKLYFRGDFQIFFSDDNPQLIAFEKMQQEFNKNDNLLIAISPKQGDIFNEKTLVLLHEITEAAWQTPYSIRVDSLSNYQHTEADNDDLLVESLLPDHENISQERIDKIKQVALKEPTIAKRLISENGKVSTINITVQLPEINKNEEIAETYNFVNKLKTQFSQQHPDVDFHLAGVIAMNHAFAYEAENDAKTLIPVMFFAIILMLILLLKSALGALATVLIIIVTITSTLGLAGWAGIFLSTATVGVPTILMTLAVADSVHVIATIQYAMGQGQDKLSAIKYSMQRNLMPIIITSLTTAVGFLTLNFSAVPILADLGNMTAAGVMLACLFSLVMLPAMLYVLPIKVKKTVLDTPHDNAMNLMASFVIKHHRVLLPITTFLMIALSCFIPLNKINDESIKYFSPATEFRQTMDFLDENLSASMSIDFTLESGEMSGINQPEFIHAVEKFTNWLKQQEEVTHVNSISDTYKRLNKNMHGDDEAFYRIPSSQDEAAQYLLMYEMSLPFGLDLNNQLNLDKSATRISASLMNMGSKQITAFEQKALSYLAEHYPQYTANAASAALMFAHIGERNMASMLKTLPLALVLISILLIISMRSWRMGFMSILPNIAPAAIGFGIWGLYSGEINLSLSVVASISLGIIVDDTVHFLAKYNHAKQEGQNTEQAVRFAFNSVGRALWVTTVVLVVGFSVLMLSNFRLNSDMGLLTAIIITTALVIDFLFMPSFLLKFDTKESKPHA